MIIINKFLVAGFSCQGPLMFIRGMVENKIQYQADTGIIQGLSKGNQVVDVILFFTAAGPLIMGIVSDANGGDAKYGFMVATVFATILFIGLLLNYIFNPTEKRNDPALHPKPK